MRLTAASYRSPGFSHVIALGIVAGMVTDLGTARRAVYEFFQVAAGCMDRTQAPHRIVEEILPPQLSVTVSIYTASREVNGLVMQFQLELYWLAPLQVRHISSVDICRGNAYRASPDLCPRDLIYRHRFNFCSRFSV